MAKVARKTSGKSSALVPQKHGGAIRRGNPGNKGGVGVMPSLLRERLRGSFADRVRIIEDIADGKPMQRTQVRVLDLMPHLTCANCGESEIAAKEPSTIGLLEIEALVSASPKDRLQALDLQAKYGLGALKEISVENVRERVAGTLAVIRDHVAPELYQRMLPALRSQWA